MLPETHLLLAFAGASLVLALTPGPAVVYIVARTVAQGRACGLASVLGVALGNLGNAIGAALGLAALFAVSSAAFTVVKWAGAAYLVCLGLRMWCAKPAGAAQGARSGARQPLALGCTFVAIAACTDLFCVLAASLVAPRLGHATRHAVWGNRLAGTSFIGLGVLTAMGSRPTTR